MHDTPTSQQLPGLILPPEFELLLCCSRPTPNSSDLARQRQLAKAIHPDTLIRLAKRHKLAPLVYCNLRQHPPGIFSPDLLDTLAKLHAENKRKAMASLLTAHQLAASGIPVCTLKGLDVAVRAYGDIAARHVGDIDLLIDEDHLPLATKQLTKQGWIIDAPEMLSPKAGPLLRHFMPDCTFQRPGYPLLELHWRPCANPYNFNIGTLGNYPVVIAANTSIELTEIDLLIFLCLHGSKHGWQRLKWLHDIPNAVENLPLDWDSLWQRARQLHADKAVQQGLMMAEKLCGLSLPAPARAGFRHSITAKEMQKIMQFLNWPEVWIHSPPISALLQQLRFRIAMQNGIKGLLWQMTSLLHPNYLDVRQLSLPKSLAWLYVPLRPLLWVARKLNSA